MLGGGAALTETDSTDINLTASRPFRSFPGLDPVDNTRPVDGEIFNAWRVTYRNPAGGTAAATGHAWAICAQA